MPVAESNREQLKAKAMAAYWAKHGVSVPSPVVEAVPVIRYKRVRVAKAKAEQRDLLARPEFEPDNSRIGCQSKGIQSCWESADWLAQWMVYDWHLEHRPLRWYMHVAPEVPSVPFVVVREAEQTLALEFARDLRQGSRGIDMLPGESSHVK